MKTYNVVISAKRNGANEIGFNGVRVLSLSRAVAVTFTVRKNNTKPGANARPVTVDLDGAPLFTVAPGEAVSIRVKTRLRDGNPFAYTVTRAEVEAAKNELIARGLLDIISEKEGE